MIKLSKLERNGLFVAIIFIVQIWSCYFVYLFNGEDALYIAVVITNVIIGAVIFFLYTNRLPEVN